MIKLTFISIITLNCHPHIIQGTGRSVFIHSYSCSKTSDVCQRCLSVASQRQPDSPQLWTSSGLTARDGQCRGNLQVSGSCLCFVTMLRSPLKGGACTLLGTISTICKNAWGTRQALPVPGDLHPFPQFEDPTALLPLKSLPLSSLWGAGIFREQALLSPFFNQGIKFLLCFAEHCVEGNWLECH